MILFSPLTPIEDVLRNVLDWLIALAASQEKERRRARRSP